MESDAPLAPPPSRVGFRMLILLAASFFSIGTIGLSWWRWWTFQYGSFDLAFYQQGLWLALRGHFHTTLLDVGIMGNHAEPIVFLLLPLFALIPHPMLFVVVQNLCIATLPFTAYRIAKFMGIRETGSVLLAILTLLVPATGFMAMHEFHPESLSAPLLLLAIEARLLRKLGRFWFWFLLTVACKENLALMLVFWSALEAWRDRKNGMAWQLRWNVVPGLLALAWFVTYALWLSPRINGGKVDYATLYMHLGTTKAEIIHNLVYQPHLLFGAIWKALTWQPLDNIVFGMLLAFGFLPLFRPAWLLVCIPIYAQHLLSVRFVEWTVYLHYAAPLIPFYWIASVQVVRAVQDRVQTTLPLVALLFSLALQVHTGPLRRIYREWIRLDDSLWRRGWKSQLLQELQADPSLSVSASYPYLSHLANREKLYSFHFIIKGLQTLSATPLIVTYLPDAVVIDYSDPSTFDRTSGLYHPEATVLNTPLESSDTLLNRYLARATWSAKSINAMTVLRRSARENVLTPVGAYEGARQIEPSTTLNSAFLHTGPRVGSFILLSDWDFIKPRVRLPWMNLVLKNQRTGLKYLTRLGMAAPDRESGPARDIKEILFAPTVPSGTYHFTLWIQDELDAMWEIPQRFTVGIDLGVHTYISPP